MNQYDKEVEMLEEELARGEITLKEFNEEMRELNRAYSDAAREAAEHAYRDEFGRW